MQCHSSPEITVSICCEQVAKAYIEGSYADLYAEYRTDPDRPADEPVFCYKLFAAARPLHIRSHQVRDHVSWGVSWGQSIHDMCPFQQYLLRS